MTAPYAELQATSNFSFLRGASHPEELVVQAAAHGLSALAVTDRNGVSGLVRAHGAAKRAGLRFVPACRFDLSDGPSLLCYPQDRAAWGRLTRLLSHGKRIAPKGECAITWADALAPGALTDCLVALVPPEDVDPHDLADRTGALSARFGAPTCVAASVLYRGDDARRLKTLDGIARANGARLLATGDVHAHVAARRPLQDVLTCIREGITVDQAGFRLFANAERHLKAPDEVRRLFRDHPDAVQAGLDIVAACRFSLDDLAYEYPVDPVPDGATPQSELARQTWAGAAERYPDGVPGDVTARLDHELELIGRLGFAPYFLTVFDLVRFARGRGILCQGRGSAANSAVCYCLGVTAVDPARVDLLFERFVSAARGEPPDIDVDFENERREEVIQYVYEKYGRDRAAMTATVITYRSKSAIRETAKALGIGDDVVVALQKVFWRRRWDEVTPADMAEVGIDAAAPEIRRLLILARQLADFPRHLSQHSGGMVMTKGPLVEVAPVANAAMEGRTIVEWDKNDLDALGILKVDILALGMLTAIRKCFHLIGAHHGRALSLDTIPPEDAAVYDMLCEADSIGVFQVESRAQMSMLPRLRPRNFYDLVIEVAIVRPGPIQGDMVHPYLRRRDGLETIDFPSDDLRQVLGKTLGVPLFQEQAMRIAIVAAGFSPGEADGLRRAMATFRRLGDIHGYFDRFIDGMAANGYARDFAERCFKQIEGFADYGFPESHAASFALLVYVSSWLKRHYPAAFTCALLNSQPMGFYAPAQLVRDAREHGVEVRPACVSKSLWDCTLEDAGTNGNAALRLGLRQIKGLKDTDGAAVVAARDAGSGESIEALWRAGVGRGALETLARADAFRGLGLARRDALWAIRGLDPAPLPLFSHTDERNNEPSVALPAMTTGEHVADDYRATRLSLRAHPIGLLRAGLDRAAQSAGLGGPFAPSGLLEHMAHGTGIRVCGIVTARQRPGSAKGVMFATIEDETGVANLIVWPKVFERFRSVAVSARVLGVKGPVQREGKVVHVLAERLIDLSEHLSHLDDGLGETRGAFESRDFH